MALGLLLLVTSCAGDESACSTPKIENASLVTTALAYDQPCENRANLYILKWYWRGQTRYPLRCGQRDVKGRGGWGYLHILYDESGHGDAMFDHAFSAEITHTVEYGEVGESSDVNRRYTVEYKPDVKQCTNAWGFRVVIATGLTLPGDLYPLGIVTAFRLDTAPKLNP